MKLILLLSKEHLKLAQDEAIAIIKPSKVIKHSNLLILETDNPEKANRLAYTKRIYQFLFKSNIKNIIKNMKEFGWQSIYKKDFCLRIHNIQELSERNLAGYIWDRIQNPKVNLKNPKTHIELINNNNSIFCGLLIKELRHEFEKRHPKKWPAKHPSTLRPRLAKALINLSGIEKGKLLDPFCGGGGILIEASLMNYKIVGYDLSKYMLIRCEKNLKHHKITEYKLKYKDATKKLEKANLIVTDPPYGMTTSLFRKDISKLYEKFLKSAELSTNHLVMIFPNKIKHKELIKLTKFKLKNQYKIRVHRSLTRNICVLEK